MGKCLSKQSKKAKDGEDPDRTPYTPASQRNKTEPIPITGPPRGEQSEQPIKGDNLNDSIKKPLRDANQKLEDDTETVWVKADGSPEKEVTKPEPKNEVSKPGTKAVETGRRSGRSPPKDTSVKKPAQIQDVKLKIDKKAEGKPVKDDKKADDKPAKDDNKPEDKPAAEVRSYSSSRTTSVLSTSSSDSQPNSVVQTSITNKSSVCDSPLVLRDSKTYSGEPRHDTSLFSKTAPSAIDKTDLPGMSVKEIRSQRTSKIETRKETEVTTKTQSSSEEQPMALLGALKYLKPSGDTSEAPAKTKSDTPSSTSVMFSHQMTTTTATKTNGEVTSQKIIKTETSSTSPTLETTTTAVKTPASSTLETTTTAVKTPASPTVKTTTTTVKTLASPTVETTTTTVKTPASPAVETTTTTTVKTPTSPTLETTTTVKTPSSFPNVVLSAQASQKEDPVKIQSPPKQTTSFQISQKEPFPVKQNGNVENVAVKERESPKKDSSLLNGGESIATTNLKPVEDQPASPDSLVSPNKISSIPVSKIRPPSAKTSISSDTSPTKPVNGSVSETSEITDPPSNASVASEEVVNSVQEEQTEVFDDVPKESVLLKNVKEDYKNLFFDFSTYNQGVMAKHDFVPNTRNKQLQQIDDWLKSESEGRVLVVIGAGGVGKTCLAAKVCAQYASCMAGSHFFAYNSPNVFNNRLRDVLISLAYQFCDVFPNYVSLLPRLEKLKDLIKKDDLPELYNTLLFYPFTDPSFERSGEENMLLVIDALDECDPQDVGVLTDVINNLNESCPQWLSVLATCRADGNIADQLKEIGKVELKRKDPDNMSDIKRYLKEPLGLFMDRISLDGGLTTLTKKTQGSFTCAQIYKNRLANHPTDSKIAMREVTTLYPDGLEQNLQEILKSYKERIPGDRELRNAYMTITSVIACAREPLSLDFIFDIVGAKYFELCKEAVKEEMGPLLNFDGDKIEFLNHCIVEWLLETKSEFKLDREIAKQELASLCTKWITGIVDGDLELDPSLKAYALKHSVYHLTDLRGNTDAIGKILCSLKYAREKLCLPGIGLHHLLDDYEHQHMQVGSDKIITVKEYMRKYPQIWQQIRLFEKFIYDKKSEINACPRFIMHVAANYSRLERIQQNAKAELESEPWLEDLTAVPETHCVVKNLGGTVRALDISGDGKTVAAVVKDEDYNVKLLILNGQTGEERVKPIDIKSLSDRVGVQAKFMPDGNNIFVGSLTTLISKQGKQVPSGLDVTTVDLREKYSIECCDVSARYFGLGLTTFPWGGRSLHLSVFDMKTKKCLNTIEILRFRFGGSAQFCIKSVGMAKERPLVCACVKQSTKSQLRVIVWNITKFQVVNSIDITNDDVTKSIFIADHTLLLGSSLRSSGSSKSNLPAVSEFWNFKEVTNKSSHPWDASEQQSLFAASDETTVACRWYSANGNAILEQWRGDDIKGKPVARHTIRGLSDVSEMQIAADVLLFVSGDELYLYNVADLEPLDVADTSRIPNVSEVNVESLTFLPKSDTAVITAKRNDHYSVYLCDLSQTDPVLVATPFDRITPAVCKSMDAATPMKIFSGPTACTERCFSSADGNYLFFNSGDHVKVLDKSHNSTKNIPGLKDLNEKPVHKEYNAVKATASMKDNFIAVVYGQIPNKVFLYDVRSCTLLRKISLNVKDDQSGIVTDFTFMPAMGYLLTFHHDKGNVLAVWNSRTGDQLSEESLPLAYGKASPALDRFVVSTRKSKTEGNIILRNADNKFCKQLSVGDKSWLADNKSSDVEFSSDGTILVGVCQQAGICRVWNAANGESLQDLPALFNGPTDVVGMLTNTHVLFHDDRLQAMDVASGDLIAVLPLEHQVERRCTSRGLRVSTRGAVVSGATTGGVLCIFSCHNFTTVKRKTTLQRMKSFRK